MKTYIAISLLENSGDIDDVINKILMTTGKKTIYVFDITKDGMDKEIKRFLKSYNRYGVFFKRLKRASSLKTEHERINLGIAESILHFNSIKSDTFSAYVHINQHMLFQGFDLNILVNNAKLYHGISPVVHSINGVEVIKGITDRYGIEFLNLEGDSMHFITGEIEESFALNPKCFAMSRPYANRLHNFTISNSDPVYYLNHIVFDCANFIPKVDTNVFVHENLY